MICKSRGWRLGAGKYKSLVPSPQPLSIMIKSYQDLDVWKIGMEVAIVIYSLTAKFPSDERFGLVSQIRRAAVSIPSNIAEGHARKSRIEFRQFIFIALGSLAELETQLLLSNKLDFISKEEIEGIMLQLNTLCKMLRGLSKSLSSSPKPHD